MNKKTLTPDFCVIGAGSAGLSFAAGASQMGASVVLLESKKMGGDCLNYGCVPSKALIAAAKFGHEAKRATKFGWNFSNEKINYKKVYNHINEVVNSIAPNDSIERFEKLGVNVISEQGKFISKQSLETNSYVINAKRFIIATGSFPFIPKIDGLSEVEYLTNETIFDLQELPNHLVIIGAGPIGTEMSQAFIRLGSKVTVLDAFKMLPKDEPALVQNLKSILISEGVNILENVIIKSVSQNKKEIKIHYSTQAKKEEILTASHLIVAAGRRANIANLNLESAGVNFSSSGIQVNQNLQTSNPKIYAIGDCTGGYQFTHVAGFHASLAIRNSIFGMRSKFETKAIPWVTYTDPELAHVGYLESQLIDQNVKYKSLTIKFDENDRAQTERQTGGSIKVLASSNGKILGVSILGSHAGELIYPWVLAIQNNLKLSAIASAIAPYPTLNDISKRIAGSFYTEKLFSSRMKRFVRFIMRWFR